MLTSGAATTLVAVVVGAAALGADDLVSSSLEES